MATKSRYAELEGVGEVELADKYTDLDTVLEDRQKIRHLQVQYLEDNAGDDVLSGEKREYYDKLESDIVVLDKLASGFRREAQMLADLDEQRANYDKGTYRGDDGKTKEGLSFGDAIKQVTMQLGPSSKEGEFTLPQFRATRNTDTGKMEVALKDTPIYLGSQRSEVVQAMNEALYNGAGNIQLSPLDRSNTNNPGITGGLPELVIPMVKRMFDIARVANWVSSLTTPHGNTMKIRRREYIAGKNQADNSSRAHGDNPSGNIPNVAEGGTITKIAPTYAKVSLEAHKFGYITDLTYELIADLEGGDIEQELVDDAGTGMGLQLSHFIVNGDGGSNEANGIGTELIKSASNALTYKDKIVSYHTASAAISAAPTNNTPTLTYKDIVDMLHLVSDGYVNDPSCAFFTSWYNVGKLRQVVDSQGRPIFDMDPTGVFPGRVVGKPVVADPAFPNIPDAVWTTGNNIALGTASPNIVFGAWKGYKARYAEGMRVDRSSENRYEQDEISWRFLQRFDGDVVDPNCWSVWSYVKCTS